MLLGCAQNKELDIDESYAKIDSQNDKAHQWVNSYPDSAVALTRETCDEAKRIHYKEGESKALSVRAIAYSVLGQYDSSIILNRNALDIRRSLSNKILTAKSYSNIGETYQNIGELENAIAFADSAYHIYLAEDSIQYLSGILGNKGICYIRSGNIEDAKRSFLKSIYWAEKVNGEPRILLSAYKNYGIFAYRNVHPDTSILYKQKSIQLAVDNRMDGELAGLYLSLGRSYVTTNLSKANTLYDSAIALSASLNLPTLHERILKAKLDLPIWPDWQEEKLMFDSLLNTVERNYDEERLQEFAEFEVRYNTAETKAKNDLLESQAQTKRKQQYLLIFVIAGLILALLFIVRNLMLTKRIAEKDKAIAEQRIDSLIHGQEMDQIDQMLEIQEKERKRIATELHDGLGSLLGALKLNFGSLENHHKSTFETTPEPYNAVKHLMGQTTQEVRRISHDMSSLVLSKFGLLQAIYDLTASLESSGSLHIELHENGLEGRLSAFQELTLYRILQELVSNTLKHANAKSIEIHLTKSQNQLMMMVIDDGRGFDVKKLEGGLGLQNVKDRVRVLNGQLSIDSHEKSGTTVAIEMELVDE